MNKNNYVHAMSIDLEDYFMVSAFEKFIPKSEWGLHESRVMNNTYRLLRLLQEGKSRATFFTLGWVAERFPKLIRDIAQDGHELGCHGYHHRLIYDQTPQEFEDDIRRAKEAIETAGGRPVLGYRAPSFSLINETPWAWKILEDAGFQYDASIFPAVHARGGIKGSPRGPHQRRNIIEFPMSVFKFAGLTIPFSGGGYFRLLPYPIIRYGINRCLEENRPAMMYLHPWEFDPQQPKLSGRWFDRKKTLSESE